MAIRLSLKVAGPLCVAAAAVLYACGSTKVQGLDTGADASSGGGSGAGSNGGSSGGGGSGSSGASNGGSGSSGAASSSGGGSSGGAGSSSGTSGSGSGGASSGGSSGSGSSTSGSGSGGGDGGPAIDGGTTPGAVSVTQHHLNASRDGFYTDALMTKTYAATLKLNSLFAANGNIYAQPLYVSNGPGGKEAFVVATETNHVTAVDGTGATLWDQTFGAPATSATLPCGIISPLGITGTPVIDLPSRTIFFDAMTDMNGTLVHLIHAISLDTGTENKGWPVNANTAIAGFDSAHQNQRGALALLNGTVYVVYGGHVGDCGGYHGWVVGIPIANPAGIKTWSTGAIGMPMAFKGGIWASGGASSDGTSLYVSTGNTSTNTTGTGNIFSPPANWSGGEAVFRLAAGPTFSNQVADYYYPTNWSTLDGQDADLGGANPVPFDIGTNHYIVALGKNGSLYLLNRDSLGGMGTEIAETPVSNGVIITSPAVYSTKTATYVAFHGQPRTCPAGQTSSSLGVVKIVPGAAPTMAWCGTQGLGAPMVTKTGAGDVIVWSANTRLYGYDGDTGAVVFNGGGANDAMGSGMYYMNSPIDVAGRIVVATSGPGHLYAFHP